MRSLLISNLKRLNSSTQEFAKLHNIKIYKIEINYD